MRETMTRRGFLGAATGAVLGPWAAVAQSPAVLRKILRGDLEIIIVSDGALGLSLETIARDKNAAEVARVLEAAGLPKDRVIAPVNVTFVKRGAELIAIDCGAGPNFMETAGKLSDNIAAAGIDPKAVTKVVFTHGHPDHLWGAIDEFDNAPRFPNASYVMTAAELDLWLSPDAETKLPADRANFVLGARRNLKELKDKLSTVTPGQPVAPGLVALDTAGHTQGHIAIEIAGGPDPLIVIADALLHPVVSFEHPDWRPAADHEPERAVTMRQKLLDRLVIDRATIIGTHLTEPGLGRVEKAGAAYRFVAA
jgi:glyoxylase-like metal-dependent hydrolase (beta-lactamase superfamily II)